MTPDNTTAQHDLAAAYALNALPDDEAAGFEAHLATCESCADEVASLRGVAADLADLTAEAPPADLRDSVLGAIAEIAQVPATTEVGSATPDEHADSGRVVSIRPDASDPLPDVADTDDTGPTEELAPVVSLADHRRLRWTTRVTTSVAAALVLVVGGLGLWANDLSGQVNDLDGQLQAREQSAEQVASVLNAPDAELTNVDGSSLVRSPSAGQAVFAAGAMDRPGNDEVLQMWVIDDQGITSAGLVADPETPTLLDIPVPQGTAVGVTVEPEGGSDQPTSDPVVVFQT